MAAVMRAVLRKINRRLREFKKRLRQFKKRLSKQISPHTPYHRLRVWLATLRRLALPRVTYVGVTGSCGKTTTARLIGTVLESAGECRTNAGLNGPRQVVMNVLSVGSSTKFCVQEISGSCPGRIRTQTRILRPQIGVVTTIGSDHYKRFRGLEPTASEKGKLVQDLPKHGFAILNADDPNVCAMAARTRARVITYGRSPGADVRAVQISSNWPDRLALTVVCRDESIRIQTQLVGEHWTTSVLAAVACGIVCRLDLATCVKALETFKPVFGRYSVHRVPEGPVFVLDVKAPVWTIPDSLRFLACASAPRRTIIFGTISDYPGAGSQRYRRIAREALQVADRVVFVGPQSGYVSKLRQAESRDRLFEFQTTYEASMFMSQHALPEELILLKGSIAVDHLERIVLSQIGMGVVCWREHCRRYYGCPECRNYRRPHAPPFGLAGIVCTENLHPDVVVSLSEPDPLTNEAESDDAAAR